MSAYRVREVRRGEVSWGHESKRVAAGVKVGATAVMLVPQLEPRQVLPGQAAALSESLPHSFLRPHSLVFAKWVVVSAHRIAVLAPSSLSSRPRNCTTGDTLRVSSPSSTLLLAPSDTCIYTLLLCPLLLFFFCTRPLGCGSLL
jgi:ferredoxin-NADP reductase